ncbi:hypothetical protein [Nocardia vaccinii]|uniref:hypothetical protein n=1 Tax=Nocardia vaccinii TaxID=1822 RepID=UPI000829C225|nr:hypothetical protein [Nocardia vaccinii]
MNGEYVDLRRWRAGVERSPLAVVSSGFDRIADEPVPAGPRPLPHGVAETSWGAVRGQLLGASLPFETVDSLWGWLIEHARRRWATRGGEAVLACCGLAVPMLAGITGRYAVAASPHRLDAEAEIVAGFVRQVREIDLDPPHLWPRLRFATWHAGRSWAQGQRTAPLAADLDDGADHHLRRMQIPPGHPELVLAQAVAAGVITAQAAELIVATRLQQQPVISAAQQLRRSQSYWMVRRERQRAEHALAAWLSARARDTEHTSVVEARVMNDFPSAQGVDPAQRPEDQHPRRAASATGPVSGSDTDEQTVPGQPIPASMHAQKGARRCA